MMSMKLIEKALKIALEAHLGQTDKSGEAYILHPLRLMGKMSTDYERATALLHDVVEDSSHTSESLKQAGIPQAVIEAVTVLTKIIGESYEEFIERVRQNELARSVKLADLEDNINVLRLNELNQTDLERVKKYHSAWKALNRPKQQFHSLPK